ncbi:MAG: hypothetical protein Q9214_003283, partial [Letrouitia sp. 1 TL-2023]
KMQTLFTLVLLSFFTRAISASNNTTIASTTTFRATNTGINSPTDIIYPTGTLLPSSVADPYAFRRGVPLCYVPPPLLNLTSCEMTLGLILDTFNANGVVVFNNLSPPQIFGGSEQCQIKVSGIPGPLGGGYTLAQVRIGAYRILEFCTQGSSVGIKGGRLNDTDENPSAEVEIYSI